MAFDVSRFFKNFAEGQEADHLMPGRSYEFELTEEEVIKTFGEVPAEDSTIRLGITLNKVTEDKFELKIGIN
ncbi:MAG: hypothetical protein WC657_02130 [Candidatus Paceibacterota bacterium]|jgi:hypothetical protein